MDSYRDSISNISMIMSRIHLGYFPRIPLGNLSGINVLISPGISSGISSGVWHRIFQKFHKGFSGIPRLMSPVIPSEMFYGILSGVSLRIRSWKPHGIFSLIFSVFPLEISFRTPSDIISGIPPGNH